MVAKAGCLSISRFTAGAVGLATPVARQSKKSNSPAAAPTSAPSAKDNTNHNYYTLYDRRICSNYDLFSQFPPIPPPQHPHIRLNCLWSWVVFNPLHHPPLGRRPQHSVIGEVDPAEEVYTGSESFEENFVGVGVRVLILD